MPNKTRCARAAIGTSIANLKTPNPFFMWIKQGGFMTTATKDSKRSSGQTSSRTGRGQTSRSSGRTGRTSTSRQAQSR